MTERWADKTFICTGGLLDKVYFLILVCFYFVIQLEFVRFEFFNDFLSEYLFWLYRKQETVNRAHVFLSFFELVSGASEVW